MGSDKELLKDNGHNNPFTSHPYKFFLMDELGDMLISLHRNIISNPMDDEMVTSNISILPMVQEFGFT